MVKPDNVLEVFLQPGEVYFGDESTRIRTILGSCVAITLWHPKRRIGGMCHFMLPERHAAMAHNPADSRYGDNAVAQLVRAVVQHRTRPDAYEVKLFGGGNMFAALAENESMNVAKRNVIAGERLVRDAGFDVVSRSLGGDGYRNIIFDLWSGNVWVRHVKVTADAEPRRLAATQPGRAASGAARR